MFNESTNWLKARRPICVERDGAEENGTIKLIVPGQYGRPTDHNVKQDQYNNFAVDCQDLHVEVSFIQSSEIMLANHPMAGAVALVWDRLPNSPRKTFARTA